ncbi:MAG TPA: gamma-glutamylcyclotransferase family protein [Chitinophagaceae bacterium]|nr:gamma-glutamylcyclotransferase family protein [Chitinophagaceae bacterium]
MELPGCINLFVYNTLRSGFHKMAYHYISQYFSFVDTGKISGVLTDVHGEPFATPSGKSFIHGELYTLNDPEDFSFAFGQLDDYEGLDTEAGEKPLYKRETVTVQKDKGAETNAWIYWYRGDVHGYPVISSGDTIEYYGEKNF